MAKTRREFIQATASGGNSTYGKSGRVGVRLADLFEPMRATAMHCGMTYLPPLAFEGISNSQIPNYQKQLIERLMK
ncbi:flavodoxin-like protein [Cricetibacter osteomyelitidis]|uniref:Flavodoxin-like protein n=1 Tax=Cricetibacter osteomyelitidis TaxID=1521931 RepID=A0A4R2SVB4_9PAST|nr:NAD(P)H-dependent oxidoreductase [Cricetibacter osteomyelitidis]TCP93420.1 flavodoxin-like protein [Cricetibacter osteomyelitidis]